MSDIDDLYAEWLMSQPEACVCNHHILIQRMERRWGWYDFLAQLPPALQAITDDAC